jgi:hypothetical protein
LQTEVDTSVVKVTILVILYQTLCLGVSQTNKSSFSHGSVVLRYRLHPPPRSLELVGREVEFHRGIGW